ncbi:MAG: universal stress protein [Bacillota bacterium]
MLKLLVAVDGSESSDKAVKEVARRLDGSEQVTLLTVIKEINVPGENTSSQTTTKTTNKQTTDSPSSPSSPGSTGSAGSPGSAGSQRQIKKIREKNKLEEEGKDILKAAEEVLQEKDVDIEKVLLEGNPPEQICQLAEEKDVDYIVLGNRGKGGIKKFLLGSTSEKVLRNAERSVCVIK